MHFNLLQVLRLVHILGGAFWLGTGVTMGFFVAPTLLTGDVIGAQKLERLMMDRKLGVWLPIAALFTIGSGLWLYRTDFPQMNSFTPRSLDYTLGGFLGVLALIVGVSVNFPTGSKVATVARTIGAANPTTEQSAELARLSRKLLIASRSIAILLLGAGAMMALARFAR